MKLKARYRVGELARMLDMSRRQLGGVLQHHGVVVHGGGPERYVYVSDLERRAPHIVDSLRLLPDQAA